MTLVGHGRIMRHVSGTQRSPTCRDVRPLLRWRLVVYYENGEERVIDVEARSGYEAVQLGMVPREDMGYAVATGVDVIRNPFRPDLTKKQHVVTVTLSEAVALMERSLRDKGRLVDGRVRIDYRVGDGDAEILFLQWR